MADRDIRLNRLNLPDLVLHEDDYLVFLNKPAGISSLQERNQPGTGLLELARQTWPGLRICHRLDKFTSGVLLFAKTDDAFRTVALQFQRREVDKRYEALCQGAHNFGEGVAIEAPLRIKPTAQTTVDFREGKPATTMVRVAENFRDYTLVDCKPITGRPHQIRVHLAYVGAPIVGDTLYGGQDLLLSDLKRGYRTNKKFDRGEEDERPLNHGFVLCARRLTVRHPGTQEPITVEAPREKHFEVCLKVLRKHNALRDIRNEWTPRRG